MSDAQQVNNLTSELIRHIGSEIGSLNNFSQEMLVLEGIIAGVLGANVYRHNKNPDEMCEALFAGVRERLTKLIYGAKQ